MKLENVDGLLYSRSEKVSQSENSSASLSLSDPEEAIIEEQEPSSSGILNEFCGTDTPSTRQPWARRKYQPTLESLHDEIIDLYLWLKPTAEEIFLRRTVFHQVADQLKLLFSKAQVDMFGSVATNLFLPSSDIDISINLSNYSTTVLYDVAEIFRRSDAFDNIKVIDRAFVPIVKLRHRETRFFIDISFNTHENVLKNVEYLNKKKHVIPELEPLVLVLKQFLAQRKLNHPFNGGLSSYGLILMVLGFLKCYSIKTFCNTSFEKTPLGVLLLEFFRFYGTNFDYSEYGLRLRTYGCPVVLKEELAKSMNEDKCSSILFIEDPIQRQNNVGKSAHNMLAVRDAFHDAAEKISEALVQCQNTDPIFIKNYYWGPMISLIITFSDEEIEYRKFKKNAFWQFNKEVSCGSRDFSTSPLSAQQTNNQTKSLTQFQNSADLPTSSVITPTSLQTSQNSVLSSSSSYSCLTTQQPKFLLITTSVSPPIVPVVFLPSIPSNTLAIQPSNRINGELLENNNKINTGSL